MNISRQLITIFFLIVSYSFTIAQDEISILTWNIKDLGKTKNGAEIEFMATVMKEYDIIAIQEVVAKDPAGVRKVGELAQLLNRMGSKWDYRYSNPTTGSPNEKERYAFIWKTAVVKLQGRPWLDKTLAPIVCREPYLARFSANGNSFLLANYHSIPHSKKPQWENEQVLQLPELYPDDKIIMAGDYNINSKDVFWSNLGNHNLELTPYNAKSTLRKACTTNNNFTYTNHAIDFFIYEKGEINIIKSSVVDYVSECKQLELARTISDHLPVGCSFSIIQN